MRRGHLLGAAGAVLAIHACDYPEFQFSVAAGGSGALADGGAGAGGGATAAGAGGVGADPGFGGRGGQGGAAGGLAGGAGSGTGGSGGAPPCSPLDIEACPGQKCSVVDEVTGETGCVQAGPLGTWSRCNSDADCAAALWCDYVTSVCKPICVGVGDCGDDATQCETALSTSADPIPGFRLCVANCDPMSPACGEHTNCVYLGDPPIFDCFASLDHGDGDSCNEDAECAAGLMCTGNHVCRPWCDTPGEVDAWCKTFVWCCSLDPAPSYDGDELGYCACP